MFKQKRLLRLLVEKTTLKILRDYIPYYLELLKLITVFTFYVN